MRAEAMHGKHREPVIDVRQREADWLAALDEDAWLETQLVSVLQQQQQ